MYVKYLNLYFASFNFCDSKNLADIGKIRTSRKFPAKLYFQFSFAIAVTLSILTIMFAITYLSFTL